MATIFADNIFKCTFLNDNLLILIFISLKFVMMTSSNGNIFRVTGPLCGELSGHRWIPRTKASDAELWCFLWSTWIIWLSKQSCGWWFGTPLRSLWRHCNVTRCPINNNPSLVQIMAWCRIGNKPLSEPMLTRFADAFMRHKWEMGW